MTIFDRALLFHNFVGDIQVASAQTTIHSTSSFSSLSKGTALDLESYFRTLDLTLDFSSGTEISVIVQSRYLHLRNYMEQQVNARIFQFISSIL